MSNPTLKELYQWIADEAENLKSEESSSSTLAGTRDGHNFDWRSLELIMLGRLRERQTAALSDWSDADIRFTIYEWWTQNAPIVQLREQATYLRMSVQFGEDDRDWLETADELDQLASERERNQRRNPPPSGDN
jgi:hypothetical protein